MLCVLFECFVFVVDLLVLMDVCLLLCGELVCSDDFCVCVGVLYVWCDCCGGG